MKFISSVTLFLLSCILLSTFVLADIDVQTYETLNGFSVAYGANDVTLCQCESGTENLIITNTGAFASRYTIAYSSSDMVTLSQGTIDVLPNQKGVVHIFYQAPCDDTANRAVQFVITDIFGNEQVIEKSLAVEQCQNLDATLIVSDQGPIDPCEEIAYTVEVVNTGVFTEEYEVNFGGDILVDAFAEPLHTFTLASGQTGIATSDFVLECGFFGNVTVPVQVIAQKNGLKANLVHELIVEPAYGFSAEVVINDVCAYDTAVMPVVLTNDAAFENTYSLSLSAPAFVGLSATEVTIAPGDEKILFLNVSPSISDVGDVPITLSATSILGGFVQSIQTNLFVVDCYAASINVDLEENIVDCAGYRSYPLVVQNTGTKTEEIRIDVFGSEYASVNNVVVELDANESYEQDIIIDVPPAVGVDTTLTLQATVLGVEEVTATDTIDIKMLDERACFEPALVQKNVKGMYNDSSLSFAIKNNGLVAAEYEVAFDGADFFALDADNVSLALDAGMQDVLEVLMYQDDTAPLNRYNAIVRLFARSADDERTLTYELPLSITLHARSPVLRAADYFNDNPCHFVSLVLLIFIIIALLILIAASRPISGFARLFGILLVLWIIAILVFVSINGLPQAIYEEVPPSEDPLVMRFAEDTTYSLNLSTYFEDPDGDTLDFLVSGMENVSTVVVDGVVTFTPSADWFGEKRFRVTAFDGNGADTESPRMELVVVDQPEYDAWSLYDVYCGYVNLVLLFFVLLLIAALGSRKKKVEKKEEPVKKVAKKKTAKKKVSKKKKK